MEERTKYFLKIGVISVVVFILIFLLVKIFIKAPLEIFTLPPEIDPDSPEGVAIKYLWEEQRGKRWEAEDYLHPNFFLVRVFDQYYPDIRGKFLVSKEKEDLLPEFKVINRQIEENEAIITLEEITNRERGNIFFGFPLPERLNFEIMLLKLENQWKIIKVDSPDLVFKTKVGEKVEIKKDVFVTLIKIEDSTLEIEYENKSNEVFNYNPFDEWKIISWDGKSYTLIQNLLKPALSGGRLNPGNMKRGYLSFELPKDILIREIVFRIPEKKIIFQIPVEIPEEIPEKKL